MPKMKAVFGLWADIQVGSLNKLLKPYGVRLVKKTSKDWGAAVSVSAHPLGPVPAVAPSRIAAVESPRPETPEGWAALLPEDRRERFWEIVASGVSNEAAYTQCRLLPADDQP